jgi:mono/diheme cytochrome c family protein
MIAKPIEGPDNASGLSIAACSGLCRRHRHTGGIMFRTAARPSSSLFAGLVSTVAMLVAAQPAQSQTSRAELARGKYLVQFGGCIDCHTPGYFFGKPDMARALSGSEVGFEIPGLGVFHGPNLTPDKDTGLGTWTKAQIVTALQKGVRPDGRQLAPIMPSKAFANLTKSDANAIAGYLKSLAPVSNKVPGPFGPTQKPTSFVMKVVPPEK